MTLRIPPAEALLLARRARAAEMSQGKYVAQLVMGLPPPGASPDLKEAHTALSRSTATLAALSSDIQSLARSAARNSRLDADTTPIEQLAQLVSQHLALAAPVLAALNPARRAPPCRTE